MRMTKAGAVRVALIWICVQPACAHSTSLDTGDADARDTLPEDIQQEEGPCAFGLTDCGGTCTDTASDHANCGSCGHECGAVETCSDGACVLECPSGEVPCWGRCVDLMSDFSNCGDCGRACNAGQVCNDGGCAAACSPGLVNCSGSCVDLSSNRLHCGGCDQPCAEDQGCVSGICQSGCGNGVCSGAENENPCSCPADCGSCTGCCASSFCVPGLSSAACGLGGGPCDACTGSETCVLGVCRSSTSTVCFLTITPETGSVDVTFYATLTSNGSGCTADFDGTDYGDIDCNFEDLAFSGRDAGVGPHRVDVHVASGPSGPADCYDTFTVTETTTCRASVTPTSGTTAQTFYATTETNGSDCTAAYDGVDYGAVECNNTDLPLFGGDLGVGTHTITLYVGSGPSGPTSCSASFTVTQATTCDVTVTPSTGTLATTFYATTETNGSDCTVAYDGVDYGPFECNNTDVPLFGGDLGVGTHTITLNVGAGPSGPASCSDSFTVNP